MQLLSAPITENAKFKAKYGKYLLSGFCLSILFHLGVIFFSPGFSVAKIENDYEPTIFVPLPPEITVPDPPAPVAKLAVPVEAKDEPDDEITISDTKPGRNITITVPAAEGPTFTPYDTPPRPLKNSYEITYPELLRKAGIEGRVVLWLHLDETGKVDKVQVNISAGNAVLDRAAAIAMKTARFTPALQRDTPVPVWIQYPITFKLKN